ncbi:S-DNA-T family DNA segregation ATPase FtsK/SpoIIIE [Nonomuraea muscovyensis]|uniref:S-DNA-T family DNA segregation ATPase FtsK/SpoIIIE n=1 Tax=Nonomuraea muscovyensis TaxID=1124761 RepID=A0A7X0CAD8_9ACTN|nr:FtsK/SpoIIIE domain-containing protein [Nonomuraea muscovyensis]MBB6351247.1 S-DNA-T family DNA segregation ATPase FtsK/SpoIIIE [Nonomuraea muscovyensis]
MTGSASNQDDSPRRPGLFPLASFAWTDQSSESDQASQDTREGDDHESQDDPFFDRESVLVAAPVLGPAVDPPDDGVPPDRSRTGQGRAPILPLWARTGRGIRAMVTWWVKDVGYVVGYHVVRLPKYAAKTLLYAPVGLFAGIGRVLRWASAEEGNWALRQAAADRNDPMTWLKLDKQRERQSRWRWSVLIMAAIVIGATVPVAIAMDVSVPDGARLAALGMLLLVLARAGRPADKPITDRVSQGPRYRKLTAELVRRGLLSIGIQAINQAVAKDQHAISFPRDIHRDGPGHLAIIDLPFGVEAADVVARRGRLASALRLPLDQVWPEPASGHPGRLALWVGYEPASKMKQPEWPLLRAGSVDVFQPFLFATTPRMEFINAELMYRNWLIGGQPGSGKTFLMRLLVLAASLDPRVELRGYEFKGVGDFKIVEPVCSEYGNGSSDQVIGRAAALVKWLYAECERRAARISHYHELGKAPENKVTAELASLKGSGLHPLVVFLSEAQELFQDKTHGKEAGEICEKVIKLGRALGVILLIDTQIPDKDSLPTGITRNVNTRMCMSVADQVANDMILGTSMYRMGYRATVFEPVAEAGWGIVVGLGKPGARRGFEVDTDQAKHVIARAIELRVKAGTMPAPDEQTRADAPAYDLLADLARVWPAGQDKAWNEALCARLAELRPEVYGGWQSEQLTSALKPHGVKVGDIGRRINGKKYTRRGIRRSSLAQAIAERDRNLPTD